MDKLKLTIIISSIRSNRFGDKPAKWISEIASKNENFEVEVLDLKDYPLPMFAEEVSPTYVTGEYARKEVNILSEKINLADAFVVVTPEYNHGYPASLKSTMDYLHREFINKPIAFVGYGSVGGARAVEQLRLVAVEFQMAPIRNAVHIFSPWLLVEEDGSLKKGALDQYEQSATGMLEQLAWWGRALKTARNNS